MKTDTLQPSTPLGIFLDHQQRAIGKTDEEMAEAMNFSTPNVYQLIVAGQMKLPLAKLRVTAQALGIAEAHVLRALVETNCGKELAAVTDTVWRTTKLTANEQTLVEAYRVMAPEQDVELKVLSGVHLVALVTTPTGARGAPRPTMYPQVNLDDFKFFALTPKAPFWFDDVQAATGWDLSDGRTAMNMMRGAGLIERLLVERPSGKPRYRATDALTSLLAAPKALGSGVAPDSATLAALIASHNARGLPLKIERVRVVITSWSARASTKEVEAVLVIQTKGDISSELVKLVEELKALDCGRVNVVLDWKIGYV